MSTDVTATTDVVDASKTTQTTDATTADAAVKEAQELKGKLEVAEAARSKAEADAVFQRSEAQKAFAKRDQATKAFLDTEEGKALVSAREELAKLKSQSTTTQTTGTQTGVTIEAVRAEISANRDADRKAANEARVRDALTQTSRLPEFGAVDTEAVLIFAKELIDKGTVKVNEMGQIEGVGAAMEILVTRKPYLFTAGAKALATAKAMAASGPDGHQALNAKGRADAAEKGGIGAVIPPLTTLMTGSSYDHSKHHRQAQQVKK